MEGLKLYSFYQDAVGIDGEGIEFEWKFHRIFIFVYSSRNLTRLGEKEHPARRVQGPDHLCQCSMTLNGKQMMRIGSWNAEKVKNYARRFSQGHMTFLGPGSEEKWYGNSSHAQKKQWNCTADKKVQRFKETGHPVFKGTCVF